MELNVLVEAKKEYMSQLCKLLSQSMIQAFHDMYREADKMSKGKKVLLQFQKLLKEVPNWNDHIVKTNMDNACNSCSWFSDLLAAVFVSYVKILSSVRLKSESKKISIKLPANSLFIHTCYINAAKDLYKDPYVFHDEISEFERDLKLTSRFTTAIELTIQELLPVQHILSTYMSQTGTQVDLNADENPENEDTEDPDIEEPSAEPEPPEAPEAPVEAPAESTEPEEPAPIEPNGQVPLLQNLPMSPEDIKNVSVSAPPGESENLFDDAPEQKTSATTNGHQ
jgi:hypothetical protein